MVHHSLFPHYTITNILFAYFFSILNIVTTEGWARGGHLQFITEEDLLMALVSDKPENSWLRRRYPEPR